MSRHASRPSLIGKVQQEYLQAHETRKKLISAIEKRFDRRVVVFQTSFSLREGFIGDDDATMLEEILLNGKIRKDLLLIINSPGGFGLAAERVVNVCRRYSSNGYDVLVPHMAKSAATIVCFGANTVWMGETSELGPIDPQLQIEKRLVSVYNILKSYNDLLLRATKTKGRIEPYLQQLQAYDPRYMQQLQQEMELSKALAIQLLQGGMMKGRPKQKITKCIQMFIDPRLTLEHGRPIYYPEAKRCGISAEVIKSDDVIWETIWELQLRYDYVLNNQSAKIVESVEDSYSMGGRGGNHED